MSEDILVKGSPVRKKLILLATLAVAIVASLSVASSASAKTIKLYVTPTYTFVDACRPAAGQVRFKFKFGAKFTRKNSPYPASVKIAYSVRNQGGTSIASGSVKLKRKSGWKKTSQSVTAPSGATAYFEFKATFRSPTNGKLLKSTTPASFAFAPDDQLIANGVPTCA